MLRNAVFASKGDRGQPVARQSLRYYFPFHHGGWVVGSSANAVSKPNPKPNPGAGPVADPRSGTHGH